MTNKPKAPAKITDEDISDLINIFCDGTLERRVDMLLVDRYNQLRQALIEGGYLEE